MIHPFAACLRRGLLAAAFLALCLLRVGGAEQSPASSGPPDSAAGKKRPRVGLVLSGGGARGAAHIGVLKVLEELRVPVDCIAGTSMGAVVGGLYASGMGAEEIEQRFNAIDWADVFDDRLSHRDLTFRRKQDDYKSLFDFEIGFRKGRLLLPRGVIQGQKFDFLLRSLTLPVSHLRAFDDLPVPFRAVATDIQTGEMVVLDRGSLADAMRASLSVPGVFLPVEIGGRTLVDGGLVRNLPVDVARAMGADVVIAVDITRRLSARRQLRSAFDVTGQSLTVLMRQNVADQLALLRPGADVLVEPRLGSIGGDQFNLTVKIIALGDEAARVRAGELSRLSVPESVYRDFVRRRAAIRGQTPRLDFVRLPESSVVDARRIARRIRTRPGAAFDPDLLRADVESVYEIGEFERVDFSLADEDGRRGLVFGVRDKSWAPHYLRFGLELKDDFRGESSFSLLSNFRMAALNALGAEWSTDLQLGRTSRARTEFYQPLDYGGLLFAAPYAEVSRSVIDSFSGSRRVAQYGVDVLESGFKTGLQFGKYARLYTGALARATRTEVQIGPEGLVEPHFRQTAAVAGAELDRVDCVDFPRRGTRAKVEGFFAREGWGSDVSYQKLTAELLQPLSWDDNTLVVYLNGGSNMGTDLPLYDQFYLGGFLSLSGYQYGQLTGQHMGIGRLVYFRRVGTLPAMLGRAVYAGGSLEAGNVWAESVVVDDLRYSASVFLGLRTELGPLYLGLGMAENGEESFYLQLGRSF